jgi:hypothetical protein
MVGTWTNDLQDDRLAGLPSWGKIFGHFSESRTGRRGILELIHRTIAIQCGRFLPLQAGSGSFRDGVFDIRMAPEEARWMLVQVRGFVDDAGKAGRG